MQCAVCKNFYPPGFTKKIPNQEKNVFMCKFCEKGKDKIMEVDKVTGELFWDNKEQVINKYKAYLKKVVTDQQERQSLFRNIK